MEKINNKPLLVGVTGNIGSGKSYVCRQFQNLGVPVFYSDIAARICQNDPDIQDKVKAHFGNDIYIDGVLDRKKLADIVFNDKEELKIINSIIHPAVQEKFIDWVNYQSSELSLYVLYESAIIFESGIEDNFDLVVMVDCPTNIRIESVMSRDGLTIEEVLARMKNQMAAELKCEKSDFIIINDREQNVFNQVINFDKMITKIVKKLK